MLIVYSLSQLLTQMLIIEVGKGAERFVTRPETIWTSAWTQWTVSKSTKNQSAFQPMRATAAGAAARDHPVEGGLGVGLLDRFTILDQSRIERSMLCQLRISPRGASKSLLTLLVGLNHEGCLAGQS